MVAKRGEQLFLRLRRKNKKIKIANSQWRLGAGIFCSIAPQYFSERNL